MKFSPNASPECKFNTVLSNSAVMLSLMSNLELISSYLSQCHIGSSVPSTSRELHIFGRNVQVVMAQDCRECLELPGVKFSGPKPFEDILKTSFLNLCQGFNTDDYKRAGLTWI